MNKKEIDREITRNTRDEDDDAPIYNQEDMDGILAKLRDALRENELTHQLMWSIVEAAGGEVVVPHRLLIEGPSDRELIIYDDHPSFSMRVIVRKKGADGV